MKLFIIILSFYEKFYDRCNELCNLLLDTVMCYKVKYIAANECKCNNN